MPDGTQDSTSGSYKTTSLLVSVIKDIHGGYEPENELTNNQTVMLLPQFKIEHRRAPTLLPYFILFSLHLPAPANRTTHILQLSGSILLRRRCR